MKQAGQILSEMLRSGYKPGDYMFSRMGFVDVEIRDPMYGTYVGIRDTYLRQAIRQGKLLRITIPDGVGIADPREWIKTGKRIEKVFLRPDEPMILYANYVQLPIEKPDTEQLSLGI